MSLLKKLSDNQRALTYLALTIVLFGVVLRLLSPNTIYLNIHAERDIWRSLEIIQGERFPHVGSELTKGGYTPGPGLYLVQLPALMVTLDPRGLLVWLALLHGGGLWLTYLIGKEHFSAKVGIAATAMFATFPLAVLAIRYLWNPSYMFPLTALFYWGLLDWIFKRRSNRFVWICFSVALMTQIHISALMLMVLALVCWGVYRAPMTKKHFALGIGAVLLIFAPYIVGELATGFSNTKLMSQAPEALTTANGAVIPVFDKERVMYNVGAMKALQVALSPVFYDRRLVTGSFSYLALLGEFGPQYLSPLKWRITYLLHQVRWGYILALLAFWGMAGLALFLPSWKQMFAGPPTEESEEKSTGFWRRSRSLQMGLFFLLASVIIILPSQLAATMITYIDGEKVGVGAVRYYFVYYPIPFFMLALGARAITQQLRRFLPKGAAIPMALGIGALVFLQAFTTVMYFQTASKMRRSFKYSLYETFDWSVQKEAADILVDHWGLTPDQFDHNISTLDHTFDSSRHDIISLEMGLDYAFYTHSNLRADKDPMFPEVAVYLYDKRRNANPDLSEINVLETAEIGDLVLIRSQNGPNHEYSPIQNTWEKMEPLD